jgi:hypothetical protein
MHVPFGVGAGIFERCVVEVSADVVRVGPVNGSLEQSGPLIFCVLQSAKTHGKRRGEGDGCGPRTRPHMGSRITLPFATPAALCRVVRVVSCHVCRVSCVVSCASSCQKCSALPKNGSEEGKSNRHMA